MQLVTADQKHAMSHPMRHRITLALREAATVSELARTLRTNKGNVAHHVAVLERVGLVRRVGTRTGRGGTGVLYQTPGTELRFEGPEAVGGMLGVVEQGLLADPTAFSLLRTLRLSPEQLAGLTGYLERLVLDHPSDSPGERYVVYTAAFRA